jgi:fumarate hydratase class II
MQLLRGTPRVCGAAYDQFIERYLETAAAAGYPFVSAASKFAAQGGLDAMAGASAGLRALAVPL